MLRLRTFLGGPRHPRFAVHALKLVEIGPNLDLVHDAFLEGGEDDAALRRDFHILGLPVTWGGQPRCLPVQDSVALDELGLAINLRREQTEEAV